MARKTRTDSIAGQVSVARATGAMIEVPVHVELNDRGLIYWSEIIAMKSADDWTPHDLSYAGMLAQTMALADDERMKLIEEGAILITDKGNPFANPRATILHGLESRIKSMRQSLNIHGRAREGEARDAAKRNRQNRATANRVTGVMDDDGLIARPN